jgi:hypothetical protein
MLAAASWLVAVSRAAVAADSASVRWLVASLAYHHRKKALVS